MSNPQASRGHWLGLSVGATNLAGTRDGQPAVIRPADVTLRGMRLTGFVDRIGDRVPLIAPDGSTHHSEHLLAEALGAMTHTITEGAPVSDVAIAVPAHWRAPVVDTLRRSLRDGLRVVSDALAALTALRADPGLPTHGVIVLCDFGGSGTSITLADATSNDSPIGETVRVADFSGDHIDQALLASVVAGDGSQADPYSTAMVGSLVRLRDECRDAKERLSSQTATAVAANLPGYHSDIRVTRTELEDLMAAPLAAFLAELDDTLNRHRISRACVSAVATIGGGARIPLITQRLSEHLRAPVVTTPRPQLTAAEGAALIAYRSRVVEAPTRLTPAPVGEPSTAIRSLAWSQDVSTTDEDDVVQADSRPELHFQHDERQDHEPPRRGPLVLFGLSAVAAAVAAAVFGITSASDTTTTPVDAATTTTLTTTSPPPAASAPPPAPAPQAPQVTTVVVQRPVNRAPQPRPQAPVTQQPPAAPPPAAPPSTVTTPPTTTIEPTTTTPPTTPPTPPPTPPAPPTSPQPPPIDPGTGDGGATDTPPIDPGPGDGTDTGTPPIDPSAGGSTTDTGGATPTPET